MPSENQAGGQQWERVASELRACRESQRRAWGDLDDAILGRFLAGEASSAESEQVEAALARHPELRAMTELVRDVLGEVDPILASPPVQSPLASASGSSAGSPGSPAGPVLLPFSSPAPAKRRTRGRVAGFLRRHGSLVAAACLLLTLGVAMPRPSEAPLDGLVSWPFDGSLLAAGTASRDLATISLPALAEPAEPAPPMQLWARLDTPEPARKKKAQPISAPLAEDRENQQIAQLNFQALRYREQGNLPQAVRVLAEADSLCQQKLGPAHPVTRYTVRNLANVYQVALEEAAPAVETREKTRSGNLSADRHRGREGEGPAAVQHWKKSAHQLGQQIVTAPPREVKQHVVPVLTQALRLSSSPEERVALVRALGELGPAAGDAVPILAWYARHARTPVERQAAVQALGQMGPAARPAVATLVEGLASSDPVFRETTCQALVELGPVARMAVSPEVVSRIDVQARDKAVVVREVLKQLAGQDGRIGVEDSAECFRIPTLRFATGTIRYLARKRNLEVLIETTACETSAKQSDASEILRRMGPQSLVVRIVKDPPQVRIVASPALAELKLPLAEWEKELTAQVQARQYDAGLCQLLSSLRGAEPARK
jgi:hypothetical protein